MKLYAICPVGVDFTQCPPSQSINTQPHPTDPTTLLAVLIIAEPPYHRGLRQALKACPGVTCLPALYATQKQVGAAIANTLAFAGVVATDCTWDVADKLTIYYQDPAFNPEERIV